MRISDMGRCLSYLGFKVTISEPKRLGDRIEHTFDIEFDNHSIVRILSCPTNGDSEERDAYKKAFLDKLVKEFMQSFTTKFNRIPELTGYNFREPVVGYTTDPEMIYKYPNVFAFGGRSMGKTERMKQMINRIYGNPFYITNVIFNDPATIVFWSDGTKTVVKCQDDDIFDPEKGLAMAISKKALGNKGNYCNELKKWLPKEEKGTNITELEFTLECDGAEILKSIAENGITKTKSITFEIKDTSLED